MDLLSQKTGARKQGVRLVTGNDRLTINLDRTKTEITVDSKGAVTHHGRHVGVRRGGHRPHAERAAQIADHQERRARQHPGRGMVNVSRSAARQRGRGGRPEHEGGRCRGAQRPVGQSVADRLRGAT